MKINKIKLVVETDEGPFGFSFSFSEQLTIVRGGNSSGKSTFFNCLLYGLGMEELIGGRCERALPYAVKDYFVYDGRDIKIIKSQVFLEVSNHQGKVLTLRRPIRDVSKDQRLMEIYESSLTEIEQVPAISLYLHDPGSAKSEQGYYRFLENFLGMDLPRVPTTSGGETKLYIQEVFSAFAVEQKRGWTDYIANIPFYGIRDPRNRVVEYILDLAVFETNALRNRLNSDALAIDLSWNKLAEGVKAAADGLGLTIEGMPRKVSPDFSPDQVKVYARAVQGEPSLPGYISLLRHEYESLSLSEGQGKIVGGDALKAAIDAKRDELLRITSAHDQSLAELEMHGSSARAFEDLLEDAKSDLTKNKTAKKLRDLGAKNSLSVADNQCPTCHQAIAESLLPKSIAGRQMGLSANIAYLESQCRMLERQLEGTRSVVGDLERRVSDLSARMTAKHRELLELRSEFSAGELQTKAQLRRQVRIEIEISDLERFQISHGKILRELHEESLKLKANQAARLALPVQRYTDEDEMRISLFEKNFRANAGSFDYTSAKIQDIEINRASLTPFLAQLELREIRTDIKSDSSASDFVRLIWSYLIALYQVNRLCGNGGNHIGLLMFDEPGQHSMAEDSQRALLARLSSESGLQSIVAASFDESESVFNNATDGIQYSLISWEGKLIKPLLSSAGHGN